MKSQQYLPIVTLAGAITPPACFLSCINTIAEWCPRNQADLTCMCGNHLSSLGCMKDVCADDQYIQGRDHFWGTCHEHSIKINENTNQTTLDIIARTNSTFAKDLIRKSSIPESTKLISSRKHIRKSSRKKMKDKKQPQDSPEIVEPHPKYEESTGMGPNEVSREKNVQYSEQSQMHPDYDIAQRVENFNRPLSVPQSNDQSEEANYRSIDDSGSELEVISHLKAMPNAKVVSDKKKKKATLPVSNGYPEPLNKIYKKEADKYDDNGIQQGKFSGFTNPISDARINNRIYRAKQKKNHGRDGTKSQSNHMPMSNDS